MKRMAWIWMAVAVPLAFAAPAFAETYFGFQIGITNAPPRHVVYYDEPEMYAYEGSSVYCVDDDQYDYDMYRYGSSWYMCDDGYWFRGASYRGPFRAVDVRYVPRTVVVVGRDRWHGHGYRGGHGRTYVRGGGWANGRGHGWSRGDDRGWSNGRGNGGSRANDRWSNNGRGNGWSNGNDRRYKHEDRGSVRKGDRRSAARYDRSRDDRFAREMERRGAGRSDRYSDREGRGRRHSD